MTPGVVPSKVIEVRHKDVLQTGQTLDYSVDGRALNYTRRDAGIISAMLDAGITKLTGHTTSDDAWSEFCGAGDVIGIKIVPVGGPESLTSYELINAITTKLHRIGVKQRDIIVFDRFRSDFLHFQYDKFLKEGTRWECASEMFDPIQSNLSGRVGRSPFTRHVSGYSPEHHFDFPVPCPGVSPDDPRAYRSHLCNTVAKRVDKIISVPVLKDHVASGITFALKNLSHGLFNNVYRSHHFEEKQEFVRLNCTNDFIPTAVSFQTVRDKSTLFIGDAIICTYQGGPGIWNPSFSTFPSSRLLFATDPVALDSVGLSILDHVRRLHHLESLADVRGVFDEKKYSQSGELYPTRQIEHVRNCAQLGLGSLQPVHEIIDLSPN